MPLRLDARAPDFEARFAALLSAKREVSEDVDAAVRGIVADVRTRGDAALADYTHRFDRVDVRVMGLRITADEIAAACRAVAPDVLAALTLAHDRIRAFHERQMPADLRFTDALGVSLGWRWTAVASVGLYVPGGTASYPSSVLMNAVPAKVAGVRAHRHGRADARRRAQPARAGRRPTWPASTRSTASAARRRSRRSPTARTTIAPVAKIVGPGNAYVAAAKRRSSARSAST